jgi:hypothetical protein
LYCFCHGLTRVGISRLHRKASTVRLLMGDGNFGRSGAAWGWMPNPDVRCRWQRLRIGCAADRHPSERANHNRVAGVVAAVSRHSLNLACWSAMLSLLSQREKAGQTLTGRGVLHVCRETLATKGEIVRRGHGALRQIFAEDGNCRRAKLKTR